MKKKLLLLLALTFPYMITGCPAPSSTTPAESSSPATPSYSYDSPASSAAPTAAPAASAAPSSISSQLASLKAGILPDTSLSDAEKKLAGVLIRKTIPVFPLKIGVLLYRDASTLSESDRRSNFDKFIKRLQANTNVGQVIEISSNLISSNSDIDEIRKLASRFQVSSVIVISESYQYPFENKESLVTPIDMVTGTRTWESFAKIEAYGLDILNGVFIFSTASGARELDKYKKSTESTKNPDLSLMRNVANKAWTEFQEKVSTELSDYKVRLQENRVVPIVLTTPLPTATPTTKN